jgi:Ni/Fe-hydrogenase subunit HybB-like protein
MRKVWTKMVWVKMSAIVAVIVAAICLALTLNVLQFLLDSTPRTNLTAAGLLASFRAALPPESIGLLALSGIAAVFGVLADRL